MPMSRAEKRIAAARELRDRMNEAGDHRDALIISDVLRSLASTQGTLKAVHRDNMELRKRLGLPSFLDEKRDQ